jgi:hypothetical protein
MCIPKEAKVFEGRHDMGDSVEVYHFYLTMNKDTVWQGKYERRDASGNRFCEGYFRDGKKDSLWTTWAPNGVKLTEANWKDGLLDGEFREWYQHGRTGILDREGHYLDGLRHGYWQLDMVRMHRNGKQGMYDKGIKVGKWVELTEDSAGAWWRREGHYVDGKREGEWLEQFESIKGVVWCRRVTYRSGTKVAECRCRKSTLLPGPPDEPPSAVEDCPEVGKGH